MSSIIGVPVKVSELAVNEKGYARMQMYVSDKADMYNSNVEVKDGISNEDRKAGKEAKRVGSGRVVYTSDGTIVAIPFKQN